MNEPLPVDLKTKRVRFYDNGLFFAFAHRFADAFGYADYYTPWQGAFPTARHTRLGEGFPGLPRVNYPDYDEDQVDLHVFLDLFQADRQARLVRQGAKVWGARAGEELELERWTFKTWCKANGIGTPPAQLLVGMKTLRAYLNDKKDLYLKQAHATNRGDMDTKKWKGKHLTEWTLDQLEYDLGAFKYDTEFIAEQEIKDCIELGEDWVVIDGKWAPFGMYAFEVKGLGTVGIVKPYGDLPAVLRRVNEKLSMVMQKDQYRGFFSLEGMYTKDGKYSATDPCARLGSPSNELLQELFTNWPLCWWYGAQGYSLNGPAGTVMVSPKPAFKYGIVTMAYSEQSGKNWEPLSYPDRVARWIKLRNPYALNGQRFAVPQGSPQNVAGVVGVGNTLLEAAAALGEHVKQLDGHQIEVATDSLSKMLDIIGKANAWGATFTTDKLPTASELKKAVG